MTDTRHLHHRHIHYIDHVLQRRLMVALVVLEVIVLAVAGATLHARLDAIVEENLYRTHLATQPAMFPLLLGEAMKIIAGMVAANLVALLAADRIWVGHVFSIRATLRALLSASRELDFRDTPEIEVAHRVHADAMQWRVSERTRIAALGVHLAALARDAEAGGLDAAEFELRLGEFHELLPAAATGADGGR